MMDTDKVLFAEWFPTPLGVMVSVADETSLRVLSFEDDRPVAESLARQQRQLGREVIAAGNEITGRMGRELEAFFAGKLFDFTVPLAAAGSEFEQKVWAELLTVPLGETCSYGDIAKSVGGMETVRAVGKANGANPIGIVIPCHRCIGSDGSLTGYGGGLWRKKWLLRHEGQMRPVGLFAL
jgi:AraC family transcriptional regulator of adaptative response/methylated-DNA-[protein]-cysteine methyltransferase